MYQSTFFLLLGLGLTCLLNSTFISDEPMTLGNTIRLIFGAGCLGGAIVLGLFWDSKRKEIRQLAEEEAKIEEEYEGS